MRTARKPREHLRKGSEMENRELRECPFCGGEAVLESYKARKGYEAYVQCNGGCIVHMMTITYDTEEEAIEAVTKAWNRRTNDEIKTDS